MVHEPSGIDPAVLDVRLPALLAFECVARHLNFARAAQELDISPTAVSKTVKQLERRLGVRLFNRTTRSVALSEMGVQLLASLAPALEQIRSAVSSAGDTAGRAAGTLRLNTSYVAYATLIEKHLPEFLKQHPGIRVEVSIDNTLSDIVRTNFDAGIRFGHSVQRDMIAVPLGSPQRRIVVGAPGYFRTHPRPRAPEDLLAHDCIRQRLSGGSRSFEWRFQSGSKAVVIDVNGRLMFDEMRSVLRAARMGCGLGYVFEQFAAADLESGALIAVLDDRAPPADSFYLYYPARTLMPGKLRAFIDFMRVRNPSLPVRAASGAAARRRRERSAVRTVDRRRPRKRSRR